MQLCIGRITTRRLEEHYFLLILALLVTVYTHEVALSAPKENVLFFFNCPAGICPMILMPQFVFENNSADFARSVLYGGTVDNSKVTSLDSHSSGKLFDMIVHIENNDTNSSYPFHIHHCENNYPD